MITEKKSHNKPIPTFNMMADQNVSNEFKSRGFKISQDNLDQINYNSLINSYTCNNDLEVKQYIEALENAKRTDLLDQFYKFRDEYESEKQRKLDKPFLDAIEKIIDTSKVNHEIIPYLLDVEKRLQRLEVLYAEKNL